MIQDIENAIANAIALLKGAGYRITKPRAPKPKADAKPYVFKGAGRGVFWYRGIAARDCRGPHDVTYGMLCPARYPWPTQIAAWHTYHLGEMPRHKLLTYNGNGKE